MLNPALAGLTVSDLLPGSLVYLREQTAIDLLPSFTDLKFTYGVQSTKLGWTLSEEGALKRHEGKNRNVLLSVLRLEKNEKYTELDERKVVDISELICCWELRLVVKFEDEKPVTQTYDFGNFDNWR